MKIKVLITLALLWLGSATYAQQTMPFAGEIKTFQQQDSLSFPKPGGLLFVGSSSIRLWSDLEQRFYRAPVIKRGVGGSELWQWVNFYSPLLIYPYKPSKIFVYVGENDIAAGKTPEEVAGNFELLWKMMRTNLPYAEIFWLSIKQSPSRAKHYADVTKANGLVKSFIKKQKKTYYINLASSIINPKTGLPDSALFKADLLHLNSKGYDKWQTVLTPYVK